METLIVNNNIHKIYDSEITLSRPNKLPGELILTIE